MSILGRHSAGNAPFHFPIQVVLEFVVEFLLDSCPQKQRPQSKAKNG
jgi:hypothetical protein